MARFHLDAAMMIRLFRYYAILLHMLQAEMPCFATIIFAA